ncbi:MAG: LytTR family DNA-binding domain-containing protein [Bacteroidota bacterium]
MLKVIAIDDEPLALQLITSYIKQTPFLELVDSFDSPTSTIEFLEHTHIDLIFLDIQMPDLSGTDFARMMKAGPKIIFTTAHAKYAIEGYKLDAVDYLLKPFSYNEFLNAAQKAKKQVELENKSNAELYTNNEFLFIKSDYKIRRINFNDIIYIEGQKEYVKIFIKNEPNPISSIISLKTLETKLPETKFMRVHRSFIVNLDCVNTVERSRIVFGKVYIPVTDQYKDNFQDFLNRNFV